MAHEHETQVGASKEAASSTQASFSHPLEPSKYVTASSTVTGTRPGSVAHDHPIRVQLPSSNSYPPPPAISPGGGRIPSYSTGGSGVGVAPSRTASAIDQEVDAFLLGWKDDLQAPHENLYPPACPEIPFGAGNSVMYAKVLQNAYQRRWNQLLQISTVIFSPDAGEGDIYGPLLQEVLSSGENASYDSDLLMELCVILHYRWIAMVKLKLFGELKNEVNRVHMRVIPQDDGLEGETKSPERNRFPTWSPIGFKLSATLTYFHTDPQLCAEMLHRLIHEVENNKTETSEVFWVMRGNISLSNVYAAQKKWRLSLQCLEKVLCLLEEDLFNSPNNFFGELTYEGLKIELLSRQGRILLQVGAVDEAQELFHLIESEIFSKLSSRRQEIPAPVDLTSLMEQIPTRSSYTNILLNKGMLFFAREQYSRAAEQFSLAIEETRAVNSERHLILRQGNVENESGDEIEIRNQMAFLQHQSMMETNVKVGDHRSLLLLDPPEDQFSHLSACLNNLALCALYSCQMRKAVDILEGLIRENPAMHMTEVLTFNLCTLYELGSDNTLSAKKKRTLQLVAARFGLQDIPVESFRIG